MRTGNKARIWTINASTIGYYQFGANDPDYRSSGASAHLMFETICMLAKRGIELIDFVGVNSPSRGDYKLSFNPTLKPYYVVSLK